MEFRVLGPLEVADGGDAVRLEAAKQRALLGVLLPHANEVVSDDRLIDELWGERPPATAPKLVQTYVSHVRRALGPGVIVTRAPGYLVLVDEDALDASRFRRLVREARELAKRGDHARADELYGEALALWRGPPLADVAFESFARNELDRLEEAECAERANRLPARARPARAARPRAGSTRPAIPAPRAPPRPADARALPLGAAGRRARGVPERSPHARRRARARAQR